MESHRKSVHDQPSKPADDVQMGAWRSELIDILQQLNLPTQAMLRDNDHRIAESSEQPLEKIFSVDNKGDPGTFPTAYIVDRLTNKYQDPGVEAPNDTTVAIDRALYLIDKNDQDWVQFWSNVERFLLKSSNLSPAQGGRPLHPTDLFMRWTNIRMEIDKILFDPKVVQVVSDNLKEVQRQYIPSRFIKGPEASFAEICKTNAQFLLENLAVYEVTQVATRTVMRTSTDDAARDILQTLPFVDTIVNEYMGHVGFYRTIAAQLLKQVLLHDVLVDCQKRILVVIRTERLHAITMHRTHKKTT